MSQENVEIASRATAAINDRDVAAYLALCDPTGDDQPVSAIEGPNRGEAHSDFFQTIDEAARRFELEVERLQPPEHIACWVP